MYPFKRKMLPNYDKVTMKHLGARVVALVGHVQGRVIRLGCESTLYSMLRTGKGKGRERERERGRTLSKP